MIAVLEAVVVFDDMNTVCPTLKLQAVTPESATVNTAVSDVATAAEVTEVYLVCNLPCSLHLIKSDDEGDSAPTKRKNEDIDLFQ